MNLGVGSSTSIHVSDANCTAFSCVYTYMELHGYFWYTYSIWIEYETKCREGIGDIDINV